MKSRPFQKRLAKTAAAFLLLSGLVVRVNADESPAITSIKQEGTNVVVTASVPVGTRRVTLESRERAHGQAWEPRAVLQLDGAGGSVTFRLPLSRQAEMMRVRGDATQPLPGVFYSGTNSFWGQAGGSPNALSTMNGPLGPQRFDSANGTSSTPTRDVVESDIWKIRGQTLYFFNQYRGLQIIDITTPDAAVIRSTLDMPAAGEQMYLLGTNHVVLLAREGCSYDQSAVLVVADTNGPPAIVARLPVPGTIQESRMVGTALYVASQFYRPAVANTNTWEWGTLVSSFDLSNPNAPVSRGTLWYAGYGNVVSATDVFLFVVTQNVNNWWQSTIRVIDITTPDGTMHAYGSITTAGRVNDKFKLNYSGSVFTSISEDWHWDNGTRLVTKLETFRLPDPRSAGPTGIIKLGDLELGRGERLRATRFDGSRVYIVTFFQIDPLWVVDISNPSAPRIAGSVDVPGWSTYIQPLGNRLVTVGVESNRVAVSLFDVQNLASPALLSRVPLGMTYSWSEANYDEKAFTVLPEAGLILVPFNGDFTNRYASAIQLIDLNTNSLTARGQIEGAFQFRRATVYTNRILSISGWELLSVDATDRDKPVVRRRVELAWPVDRVFVRGNFLLELANGNSWDNFAGPTLRVVTTTNLNQVLNRLSLTNLPVLGATMSGKQLYVAQGMTSWYYPSPATTSNATVFVLTVIGLNQLPSLPVLGQTVTETQPLGWGSDWQAVWPKPETLVWVGGNVGYWWLDTGGPIAAAPIAADGSIGFARPTIWPPYGGSGGGHLIAFDVADPAAPRFASELDLAINTNNWWSWWNFSKPFAADGLVFLSHQASEFIPYLNSPWQTTSEPIITIDPTGRYLTNYGPIGTWVQKALLDVVDYAAPTNPLVRKPVNIPGTLSGISHQGALLYTVGPHWTTNGSAYWFEYLDASAYDGVSAHLVDSVALSNQWPHPVLVVGTNIFVGQPGDTYTTNSVSPSVETWTLPATGKFVRTGNVTLAMSANVLADFPGMLAVQETDNTLELFDDSVTAALRRIGGGQPNGCWWFNLDHADGDGNRALWLPLGAYGVATVPVTP